MAVGGDGACQIQLAAEAMPVDSLGAHLDENLKDSPLAFARVNDDRLIGLHRQRHQLAKDLLLTRPQTFGHPVTVETDFADREGRIEMVAQPVDGSARGDDLGVARVIQAERLHLAEHRVDRVEAEGRFDHRTGLRQSQHGGVVTGIEAVADYGCHSRGAGSRQYRIEVVEQLRVRQVCVDVEQAHETGYKPRTMPPVNRSSSPSRRLRRPLSQLGGAVHSHGERQWCEVLVQAWHAAAASPADALTHGFHSYPARMHPAIAAAVIDFWERQLLETKPGELLDPFCGGGTVLIEALRRGHRSVGVDLNPLALRIAALQTRRPDRAQQKRFAAAVEHVVQKSLERVQQRIPIHVPLPGDELQWYDGHILKELGGLRVEIAALDDEPLQEALLMVFSAIVVKFSRQRSDTLEEQVPKRLRKGLVSEFFARKSQELLQRWEELRLAAPPRAPSPVLIQGDARRLAKLCGSRRFDLVLSSPPYGGTYNYVAHHARRYPWLRLDPTDFAAGEIGARRHLGTAAGPGVDAAASDRSATSVVGRRNAASVTQRPSPSVSAENIWDTQLADSLTAMRSVLAPKGHIVLVLGDARFGSRLYPVDQQLNRLQSRVGLEVIAIASQERIAQDRRSSPRQEPAEPAVRRVTTKPQEHIVVLRSSAATQRRQQTR